MSAAFDRDALLDAFDSIGRAAVDAGTKLNIAVYGGSALMLASNFRFATEDVESRGLSAHCQTGWRGRQPKLLQRTGGTPTGSTITSYFISVHWRTARPIISNSALSPATAPRRGLRFRCHPLHIFSR